MSFNHSWVLNLANCADLDEMPHYVPLHLGHHYLPKYPFRSFQDKGLISVLVSKKSAVD